MCRSRFVRPLRVDDETMNVVPTLSCRKSLTRDINSATGNSAIERVYDESYPGATSVGYKIRQIHFVVFFDLLPWHFFSILSVVPHPYSLLINCDVRWNILRPTAAVVILNAVLLQA